MENERNQRRFESVYSKKVRAGKRRTYFFDVRKTKGEDYYLTLTESTKKFNGDGYERHKIFLYKEDFNRFLESLQEAINHVKDHLMPEYDYDEFARRHQEYEDSREDYDDDAFEDNEEDTPTPKAVETRKFEAESDDDMSW
ncbi:MAG: DUF3276 family protein [Phaeodactylibacter sp.]|nr:DUF3276 family protein [Phaeodactylibacter sp.]MCB9274444.1 DUF3276 family protein [Lewinellaceae bacterium]